MKFTQKWAWQNQDEVPTGTYTGTYTGAHDNWVCRRITTPIRQTWMQDYRDKIRAIDTQEKAAKAIQDYWKDVAKEWNNGAGIITLNF